MSEKTNRSVEMMNEAVSQIKIAQGNLEDIMENDETSDKIDQNLDKRIKEVLAKSDKVTKEYCLDIRMKALRTRK